MELILFDDFGSLEKLLKGNPMVNRQLWRFHEEKIPFKIYWHASNVRREERGISKASEKENDI